MDFEKIKQNPLAASEFQQLAGELIIYSIGICKFSSLTSICIFRYSIK